MQLLRKLTQDKMALLGLIILAILYTSILFADFVAPYDPLMQNPQAGYADPSRLRWDREGIYVYRQRYRLNQDSYKKETIEDPSQKYYLQFFQNAKLFSLATEELSAKGTQGPGPFIYLLGTDQLGRDLFSRLVHGAKPSLTIGFIGLLIAFPLGVLYGGISGYFGSWIDNLMMRIAEAIMSLPSFYLLIILSAILPASLTNFQRFAMITFILSFISWAGLSRVVRGQVLAVKEREFITAAQSMGQEQISIIVKHVIPQLTSYLLVAATLAVPGFIIGESALSFLGLGINQPDPSWGNILAEGKELSNIFTRPCLIWTPALLIFASVFSFNMIGDRLRDIYDPKYLG